MNAIVKHVSIWLVLLIIVVVVIMSFNDNGKAAEKLGELDFESLLGLSEEDPEAEEPFAELNGPVVITSNENQHNVKATFKGTLENGQNFIEFKTTEDGIERLKNLMKLNSIRFEQKAEKSILFSLFLNFLPLILVNGVFIMALFFIIFRKRQGSS